MKQAPLFLVLLLLTACQRPTPEATPDHTAAIHQLEQGLLPATRIEGEEPAPATIHERMAHHKVPGLSIAFFEDGAIQWTRSYGYRSNDSLQAVDDNRLFQAASISNKCVTGCQIYLYHLEALRYKNLDRLGADCFLPFSVSRRCNTIDLFKLPGE